ncbi:transposase, partial [Candidatus Bipolaricaulota bacterium]|nr:transposase [Candidatus Bipolaricaulota bacterium]
SRSTCPRCKKRARARHPDHLRQPERPGPSFGAERKAGRVDLRGAQVHRPGNARLAKRLRKQREHLLTFLNIEGVEPTNNRAERALRPAVFVRKTGGCNRTGRGARTHAVLASLLVTARQQGLDPVNYLAQVLTVGRKPSQLALERAPPLPQETARTCSGLGSVTIQIAVFASSAVR